MNTMAAEARRKALCARLARVEGQVRGLQRLRTQLAHASPAEAAAWQCAHDMARAVPVCGTLLAQHLGDEEDLVIPLLALREAAPRAA